MGESYTFPFSKTSPNKRAKYLSLDVAKITNKQLAKKGTFVTVKKKSVPRQQLQTEMQENKVQNVISH